MTEPLERNGHDDKNNQYVVVGENEVELWLKRWDRFWESQPKKTRDKHENKKKELDIVCEVIVELKTELADECAKRRPDKSVMKKRRREVQKQDLS